jgi:hypothetical protein
MEDAMNPDYEFFTNQWKDMISQSQLSFEIEKNRNQESGFRGKLFDRLGNVMISGGTWLKKSSKSQIEDHSVAIYSRN